MSFDTKLMPVPKILPVRRPHFPATANSTRTLGVARGDGMSRKSGHFTVPTTRAEARKRQSNGVGDRTSLCFGDITKFDLMSPYAVQKLTGNFTSSFPTVAGKHPGSVRMLNVQLPKNPYAALPRLALTKVTTADDSAAKLEARESLSRSLTRSQSELSHYRSRAAQQLDRPHTESRLTRRPPDRGMDFMSRRASTISEESKHTASEADSNIADSNTTLGRQAEVRLKDSGVEAVEYEKEEGSGTTTAMTTLQRMKQRAQKRQASRRALRPTRPKSPRARTAAKLGDLTMSEYTEVRANNKQIRGQVWSGVKPRTAREDESRMVRFNTSNDVFEYLT